ncbi:unnamed protein product [Prorocentrum cordatum]|uniref:Uncharacterized protein n=1 Tax=Prorocentrum cordatum TaxID=2364126 RepID=A0ABN9TEZ2_9DINO|nr:unnamed protein product [Polarella glacialis]
MGGGASKRDGRGPPGGTPPESKAEAQRPAPQRLPSPELVDVQPAPSKQPEVFRDRNLQAQVDRVIDWESINGPALRRALPMLLELERDRRCDHWMWRPIHYAALHGLADAMQPLVEMGAAVDARTGGHAPAGKALSRSTFNFCAEVECDGQGVIVEEVDGDGLTVARPPSMQRRRVPMSSCVCTGYTQVQHSTHTRHFGYATALHIAIEYQHIGAIQALLALQADPNTSWNDERDMPLHKAIQQGHTEAVGALLTHKADPNAECCWGHFPLATAALCAQEPSRAVAKMLLEAGARRGVTDKSGKTAAQLARELGHEAFAETVESYQVTGSGAAAVQLGQLGALPAAAAAVEGRGGATADLPPQSAAGLPPEPPPGPPPPGPPSGGAAHLRELL